jgi:hypothetical protein
LTARTALILVSTVGIVLQAQPRPLVNIHSFADTSCGAWARSATDKGTRMQYQWWFRGFVSGYNYATPANQVALDKMPDMDTLDLYIDKYCREKPLNAFIGAAFELVGELAEHK